MKSKPALLLILTMLAFASFWQVLLFGFFQDDYFFLWNGLYDPFVQFANFKHPGTPLEALLFVRLLGLRPALWGLLGIVLKISTAYLTGVFFYTLTRSRLAGFLSAVFFVCAYAGASVVTSFNYHLPALVAICLLLSLIYFLKSAGEKRNYHWQFLFFFAVGVILDPARALSMVCALPFLALLLPDTTKTAYMRKFLVKFFFVFFGIGVPLIVWWFFSFGVGEDAQIGHMFRAVYNNPADIVKGIKTVGHFFASVTNLFMDIVLKLQADVPKYETANYMRWQGAVGLGMVIGSLFLFVRFLQKKTRGLGIVSFCVFWVCLFFLPNWIAEPRAAMTSQHHYQYISAIGYICLVAYGISRIKNRLAIVLLGAGFILLNVYKTNDLLSLQLLYRSSAFKDRALDTMLATTKPGEKNVLFFFSGDRMWFEHGIYWDLGFHYLLRLEDPNISHIPQIAMDEPVVVDRLCAPISRSDLYSGTVQLPTLRVSHIYAWNVAAPGLLLDTTEQMRERFRVLAENRGCTVLP